MDKHIKIYAEVLEDEALEQFHSAMSCDFAVAGALMPDAHTGYSLPIGAVVATKDVIVPAWVGYDIGCGMCAVPTTFTHDQVKEHADAIFDAIYQVIPVGPKMRDEPFRPIVAMDDQLLTDAGQEQFNKRGGWCAMGTLGGGNHFIEIGSDESGRVWVVIHSGSRGIGHGIAGHYMKVASGSDKAREGHFGLDVDSQEGQDYINDMNWALTFALHNRKKMIFDVVGCMQDIAGYGMALWSKLINRNHNHAEQREDGYWYHRKGATHAEDGMMGVIPGNMRDGSFIVRGKGNSDSLYSSSHGAGRVLSRKRAKEEVDLADFEDAMKGITAKVTEKTKDESPFAYKDIKQVMLLQSDLVDVVAHVSPIINIKG